MEKGRQKGEKGQTHRDDVPGFDVEAGQVIIVAVIFNSPNLQGS